MSNWQSVRDYVSACEALLQIEELNEHETLAAL